MFDFLLPIRFVATFLVPSVYPAMIATLGLLLAVFGPPPAGTEMGFVLNALAWIGVITLLCTLALTIKKLFGRQPSLNEVLSGLVTANVLEDHKKEQHLRNRGLEEQISAVRHAFDERANTDLVRVMKMVDDITARGEARDQQVAKMDRVISRIEERTESHLRKFDNYDLKMDNLLREVSSAAALLHQNAKRNA